MRFTVVRYGNEGTLIHKDSCVLIDENKVAEQSKTYRRALSIAAVIGNQISNCRCVGDVTHITIG